MADELYESLTTQSSGPASAHRSEEVLSYLEYVASQSPRALYAQEPQALAQSAHSLLISVQSLSRRAHKSIIASAHRHQSLRATLPCIAAGSGHLQLAIPALDTEALRFAARYSKTSENDNLARRKKALLSLRNADRVVDILESPKLFSSVVISTVPNYSSALDLNVHLHRLCSLYPSSRLLTSISTQVEQIERKMATNLLLSLRASGLKLAGSLRILGWLRRVLPDFEQALPAESATLERKLGLIFLLSRLITLVTTLGALGPLRHLADEEKSKQYTKGGGDLAKPGSQHIEKYLKRFIELYREHSFSVISMFPSLFPILKAGSAADESLGSTSSTLASFPMCLVDILLPTLREYLPYVEDQTARDSIITQVLYCAGSLGRLGGDFGVLLAEICASANGVDGEVEWVDLVKRHRLLAGRLESVIGDFKGLGVNQF